MENTDNPLKDKTCLVCQDKALGYNFNAVTCESCKAFFRRNALKDKDFKCPFNKKCEINTVTRRFCQYCRLVKCFEVGMKKEYIMSEEEKKAKKKKIEQRKVERSNTDSSQEDPDENAVKRSKMQQVSYSPMTGIIPPLLPHTAHPQSTQLHFALPSDRQDRQGSDSESNPLKDNNGDRSSRVGENPTTGVTWDKKGSEERVTPCIVHDPYTMKKEDQIGSRFVRESVWDSLKGFNGEENRSLDLRPNRSSPTSEYAHPITHAGRTGNRHGPSASPPKMAEPSSPVGSSVTINGGRHFDTSQSRSVEIYQISKASCKTGKGYTNKAKCHLIGPKNSIDEFQIEDGGACAASSPPPPSSCQMPRSMPLLSSLMGVASSVGAEPNRAFRADVADEVFRDIPNKNGGSDLGSSIDSILTEAIKLEYEAYSSMNPRINSRELNDAERAKLNELIVANKALLAPVEDDVTFGMAEAMSKNNLGVKPMLVDVLNLTAVAIRRLIKMSKKVNAFKNMCQEDQVALLKGGCTEMMILRSAMTYDSDRGSWKIPQSAERPMNIKVDVLKEAGGRVFEEHQRFLQTFDPRWRNDENIMIILSAITLFTPDRPRVVHYDVIKLEQNSYYYLLRRYLESVYPGCEARSTFLKLIHKISELHRLNEDHVRVYMELNPGDVEPLLIEIFDLTH